MGTFQLLRLLSLVIFESKRYLISHIKGGVTAFCNIISILSLRILFLFMTWDMINFPILISLKFTSLRKRHSLGLNWKVSRQCTRRSSLAEFLTNAFEVLIDALVVYFIIWIVVLQLILRTCSISINRWLINKYPILILTLTPSRQRVKGIIVDLTHEFTHY